MCRGIVVTNLSFSRTSHLLVVFLSLALLAPTVLAGEGGFFDTERRRGQFPQEDGHIFMPMPYSMPGLGSGVMVVGALANMFETPADVYLVGLAGDVEGYVLGLEDIYLIDETLVIGLLDHRISKATAQQYKTRGMNTSKDDFQLVEVSDLQMQDPQLRLLLNQRQIELYVGSFYQSMNIDNVLDKDGVFQYPVGQGQSYRSYYWGILYDGTDDKYDPRKGLRFSLMNSHSPRKTADDPDFSVWDRSLALYFPMGKQSTWAFNYRHSNADVRSQGNADETFLAGKSGCSLSDADPQIAASCLSQVTNAQAANRNGTAASLGGDQFLRAYPMGRFQGAAMAYISTEFRWNLTEEFTPFNYWIWKDVRTSSQVAFFYERGTVAEQQSALWNYYRETVGVGLRMVSASGYTYRFDLAVGDEGMAPTMMFNYPW